VDAEPGGAPREAVRDRAVAGRPATRAGRGPPVLLGGFTPVAVERVGRRAAGWLGTWGAPAEYTEQLWQIARTAAEKAGRDPDALRREVRINPRAGQTVSDVAAICAGLQDTGVDGAFVDLNYTTRSVDEALDAAAELIGKVA